MRKETQLIEYLLDHEEIDKIISRDWNVTCLSRSIKLSSLHEIYKRFGFDATVNTDDFPGSVIITFTASDLIGGSEAPTVA